MNQMMYSIMNQIIARNPQAKQLYENLKGKSPAELKQYAENVAQTKGVNLQEFMSSYGFRY